MKKIYINPQVISQLLDTECMLAMSDKLGIGDGSGGNTAETKEELLQDDTQFDWDGWE